MRQVSLVKNQNFLLFFGGQLVSRLGDAVYSLALIWMMHVLTNSTFLMSLTLVAGLIPKIVLGPIAGVFVDRWHKRPTLIATDVLRMILLAVLALLTFSHHVSPTLLIGFAFVLASISTLFAPAYYVLQRHIVDEEQLTKAYSWQQISGNISQIAGPAIAGVIIGSLGMGLAFTIDALTFVVSMMAFVLIHVDEPSRVKKKLSLGGVFTEMGDGVTILRGVPQVSALTPFMLIYNFLLAAFENLLIIQYLANVLHQGAFAVGLVSAAAAVGELVSGTLLAFLNTKWTTSRGLIVGMVISAASLGSIGLTHSVWIVGGLMFIAGFCMSIVNISFFSGIQRAIPADAMGRVWALLGALFEGTAPLSQIIFGSLAALLSVGWVITGTGLIAALTGMGALLHPAIRQPTDASVTSQQSGSEAQSGEIAAASEDETQALAGSNPLS